MIEPEACSGCGALGRACEALEAPALKCCPDCDHDAGALWALALREASAWRRARASTAAAVLPGERTRGIPSGGFLVPRGFPGA